MQPENRGFGVVANWALTVLVVVLIGAVEAHAKRMPSYNPPPLRPASMTAKSAGSVVMLTFTAPQDASPLLVAGLQCDGLNLPWVSVELTSMTVRDAPPIVFELDVPCQKFAAQSLTLAPQRQFTVAIDVADWASRKLPSTVLAGRYQAKVTWNFATMLSYHAHHPRMQDTAFTAPTAVATVPVVFASASMEDCRKTKNKGDVELVLMQRDPVTAPGIISVGLFNSGSTTVCVESHMRADGIQDDLLQITIATVGKPKTTIFVSFTDDRDKTALVTATLAPGATVWHDLDVVAWAARPRNGRKKLPAAPLTLTATYDSSGQTLVWAGKRQVTLALSQP